MSLFDLSRAAASLVTQDCALCGMRGRAALCAGCEADLPRLGNAVCPVCAIDTEAGEVCGACVSESPHFDATIAAFRYAFPLDRLVQSFKFSANLALTEALARPLSDATRKQVHTVDLVVPIPLSSQRLAARGFDQATLIARSVARAHRLPIAAALAKVRETPPQSGLDREARLKNVRGAYDVCMDVAGQRVAIVDDVMTTGATISEAARMLKRGGALHVAAWVVARAGGDEPDRAVAF